MTLSHGLDFGGAALLQLLLQSQRHCSEIREGGSGFPRLHCKRCRLERVPSLACLVSPREGAAFCILIWTLWSSFASLCEQRLG